MCSRAGREPAALWPPDCSCRHRARLVPPQLSPTHPTSTTRAGDWLVIKQVNASTLQQALNHGLSSWTGDDTATGGFPQVCVRAGPASRRHAVRPHLPYQS